MVKSLAAKAMVPVAGTVTGFVIVCCLILYSFIQADLVSDTVRHESALADVIVQSTRYAMLKGDRETLARVIADIGEQPDVEHVRIFNKKGLIMFSADAGEWNRLVDKQAAGCVECHSGPKPEAHLGQMDKARRFTNGAGEPVMAITAPIYNEPGCANGACHIHPPDQKILGTLDIGMSARPLQESLANLRWRMIVFCLMVLVLTVGGVSALLRRNVLLPVRQLVDYARTVRDDPGQPLPEGGAEVAAIGAAVQDLARRLRQAEGDPKRPGGAAPGPAEDGVRRS
jgi:hypothetical protein